MTIQEIINEYKNTYGYEPIIAYCPYCDEMLIDDPFCSKCGDVSGCDEKYYKKGVLKECIVNNSKKGKRYNNEADKET